MTPQFDFETELSIAVCKSYIDDYYKAKRNGDNSHAEWLLKSLRKSPWLLHITEDPNTFIENLLKKGREYGKEK